MDIEHFLAVCSLLLIYLVGIYTFAKIFKSFFNPVGLYALSGLLGLVASFVFIDYAVNVRTYNYLTIFFISYAFGVLCSYPHFIAHPFVLKEINAIRSNMLLHVLTLLAFFISIYVFYIVTSTSGGVIEYFGQAMLLRTKVANPDVDFESSTVRPAILHILSITFLLIAATLAAIRTASDGGRRSRVIHVTIFVVVLIISVNDISRGRFIDVILLYLFSYLAYSKTGVGWARFVIYVLGVLFLLVTATMLQGKAEGDGIDMVVGALAHFGRYFGLPLAYFDSFLANLDGPNWYGNDTLNGLFNLLSKVGIPVDFQRVENRGVTLDGWHAVLIYPAAKWFVSDFGLIGGVVVSFFWGSVEGMAYFIASTSRHYIDKALYLLFMLMAFSAYTTWRGGDNFFVLALLFLFTVRFLPILFGSKKA